jgi:hypothetical protein
MESLRGTPIDKAHDQWRSLLNQVVDVETTFESILTSPGQGTHEAEGLSLLPGDRAGRYPLTDLLARLIAAKRYRSFLDTIGTCLDHLRSGLPGDVKGPAVSQAAVADWRRIQKDLDAALDADVALRTKGGHDQYSGLLTLSRVRDSLRDAIHESHASSCVATADIVSTEMAAESFEGRTAGILSSARRSDEDTATLHHMRRMSQAGRFAELNEYLSSTPAALDVLSREMRIRIDEQRRAPPGRKPAGILMEPPSDQDGREGGMIDPDRTVPAIYFAGIGEVTLNDGRRVTVEQLRLEYPCTLPIEGIADFRRWRDAWIGEIRQQQGNRGFHVVEPAWVRISLPTGGRERVIERLPRVACAAWLESAPVDPDLGAASALLLVFWAETVDAPPVELVSRALADVDWSRVARDFDY